MWGYCFGFKLWSLCALAKPHSHYQKFHLYMLIVLAFDKATFLITLICSFQRDLICIPVTTVQPTFENPSLMHFLILFLLSCLVPYSSYSQGSIVVEVISLSDRHYVLTAA